MESISGQPKKRRYDSTRRREQARRTRADIKLNPELDHAFLAAFVAGNVASLDALDPVQVVERAGIGMLELHAWVAAAAAHQAAGGAPPVVDLYAETLEYGIAFGMLHAG